jgi:hypothetical protein
MATRLALGGKKASSLSSCLSASGRSIHRLLDQERGAVAIIYGHHVPGCESFFDICANEHGLTTIHHETRESEYQVHVELVEVNASALASSDKRGTDRSDVAFLLFY